MWRGQEMIVEFWWVNLLENCQCEDREICGRITLIFILRRLKGMFLAVLKLCVLPHLRCQLTVTEILISGKITL
jgi:hypothetical protein